MYIIKCKIPINFAHIVQESYIVRPPKNVDDIREPCAIASAPLPPSPSAPTANITAFGIESECSICFERTVSVTIISYV